MRSLLSGSVSAEPGTGNQVGVLADDGDESDESDESDDSGSGVGWENVLSSLFLIVLQLKRLWFQLFTTCFCSTLVSV